MKRAMILDGYVDEPACFGVPPYISPYVRYIAGVLLERDYIVSYCTCDTWRQETSPVKLGEADLTVVIAGMTVPGRYRGGTPLSLTELRDLAAIPRRGQFLLAGPILHGYSLKGGSRAMKLDLPEVDFFLMGEPEVTLAHLLDTGELNPNMPRDEKRLETWAELGANIVRQHSWFPWIMAEIELSKGCDRKQGHCSFCTEGRRQGYEERSVSHVIREVIALYRSGVRSFRFGRCANILAYGGNDEKIGRRPNPAILEYLYREIRHACPDLQVLHTDNANPLTITRFPEESARAIEVIARWNTPGDVLSLGLENLDPKVKRLNNLKVSSQEATMAIRIINQAGGSRKNPRDLPSLLPGLNFLFGLAGETKESLAINRNFLEGILAEGLMLRRINIRKVIVHPHAILEKQLENTPSKLGNRDYERWKRWVRQEIDTEMLRLVAPAGTIIRNILIEEKKGNINFGRPLGSYPPLVGIPCSTRQVGDKLDVAITDHGSRSLTGIPYPLTREDMTLETLMALPHIGKARAHRMLADKTVPPEQSLDTLDESELRQTLQHFFH